MSGVLMIDLAGTSLTAEDRTLLQNPLVAGVIFFSRNFESVGQMQGLTESIRSIRSDLLLAVDQEGGRVQRFQQGFTRIPAMQRFLPLFRKNSASTQKIVTDTAWLMASELFATGIDISFTPVLDMDDQKNPAIADRAFSPEADEVVALGRAWIEGMKQAGMSCTGKHFPGHGSVVEDSHQSLPVDPRPLQQLLQEDLRPFSALISELDALMPAHILFPEVDSVQTVGFSSQWLQDILRQQLGFSGVIFSDDLSMKAVAEKYTPVERARLALSAGCNLLLLCNDREASLEVLEGFSGGALKAPESMNTSLSKTQKSVAWSELKTDPRWQQTRQFLQLISS